MKMITAVIKPFRLENVRAALSEAGVSGAHITECHGCPRQGGLTDVPWRQEYPSNLIPEIMLHLAVPADQVKAAIEAIIKGVRTGKSGDGKIFVSPINEVVRIRTGDRDHRALT
jgi:nitrogen regulatory protein P-II 1